MEFWCAGVCEGSVEVLLFRLSLLRCLYTSSVVWHWQGSCPAVLSEEKGPSNGL
jgi:hypothetical protein